MSHIPPVHSFSKTEPPAEPRKKLGNILEDKVSTLWKKVVDWPVIPKSIRAFSSHLQEQWKETVKRIGYAAQIWWPNLFPTTVTLIEQSSTPSVSGKESILYVLKRIVGNEPEPLVEVGGFTVGAQVSRDIPRTAWPLSYQTSSKPVTCPSSQDTTHVDTKSAKILNWLNDRLASEPNISGHNAQKQAIINLAAILFHQSVSVDKLADLGVQLNDPSKHNPPVALKNASTKFYSNASIRSDTTGLTIQLTWNFDVFSLNNRGNKPLVLGQQILTRTIQIPWDELTADWAKNPPSNPKYTVHDTLVAKLS